MEWAWSNPEALLRLYQSIFVIIAWTLAGSASMLGIIFFSLCLLERFISRRERLIRLSLSRSVAASCHNDSQSLQRVAR